MEIKEFWEWCGLRPYGDGWSDSIESMFGGDPTNSSFLPPDPDGDGFSNAEEEILGSDPLKPDLGWEDTDGDNIPNLCETLSYNTSYEDADSDNDGIPDDVEIQGGSDPNDILSWSGPRSQIYWGVIFGVPLISLVFVAILTRRRKRKKEKSVVVDFDEAPDAHRFSSNR